MNPIVGFLRALGGKVVVPHFQRTLGRFEQKLQNVRQVQRDLLLQKVRRCARSQFGVDHHFHEIRTLEDFRRNIPIAQYDYYYPYIKQVTEGNVTAMFPPARSC